MSIPDLFGPLAYSDFGPPFLDHLHERPQPHPSLLQYLTHRKPRSQQVIYQPDIDIRDAGSEFVIEVEVPGVSDKNAVKIEWSSSRTLTINGQNDRPPAVNKPSEPEKSAELSTGTRGPSGEWIPPPAEEASAPTLVVAERRIGLFRRQFNFPVDVDMEHMTAKLDSGLLMLHVPKKPAHDGSSGRVTIQ